MDLILFYLISFISLDKIRQVRIKEFIEVNLFEFFWEVTCFFHQS